MFPGLGGGDRYLTMDEIRTGHAYDLDVVSGNEVTPIRIGLAKPEGVDSAGQSIISRVVGHGR
jgi:hypothetical protein